ncbi:MULTISPECIES: chromosome partitioning protein ParA [Vibrio]|uniref:chromosome partitioning protein ParA n=1 Tax=Vibrio TaxID=662 RepID=UPI000D3D9CF0|nr:MULTISPECIES: chromosome partitioning protein ParA [unclassified Vibrio]PTP12389.1 chromosome partitioning protein ParA [Vibrio sp. 10N.286.51.C3]TKE65125.1 chromosome partitioning protein ParA [Vibrio sp. F12]TKE79587.1 chromosome partitioning protein ParA [Vibrio sp. F12]
MLVLTASIIGYSWSSKSIETPQSSVEHTEAEQYVSKATDDYSPTSNTVGSSGNPVSQGKQDHADKLHGQTYAENLTELAGKALLNELEEFWTLCQQAGNCTEQLAQLKSELPMEWFELLSNYPKLSADWQVRESTIPLESIDSLEARIELFKQSAQEIWGELAHQLFADQFAHLNFTLSANTLEEVEATEFVSHYQDLLAEWANKTGTLNAETPAQQYELAISLLPNSYSSAELATIKVELQEIYLDAEQADNIVAREQQVVQQQQTVMTYHEQLDQLKSSLDSQRSASHANWDTQEWNSYYQQQVTEFREQFFRK